jgi:hypothetical protein
MAWEFTPLRGRFQKEGQKFMSPGLSGSDQEINQWPMMIPRLGDMRTSPVPISQVIAATGEDVSSCEMIGLESVEDTLDGVHATSVGGTEPLEVPAFAPFDHKVSDGLGDIRPASPDDVGNIGLPSGAVFDNGQRRGTFGSEITGELDVGYILDICVEVLRGATSIGVGEGT